MKSSSDAFTSGPNRLPHMSIVQGKDFWSVLQSVYIVEKQRNEGKIFFFFLFSFSFTASLDFMATAGEKPEQVYNHLVGETGQLKPQGWP